MSLIGFRDWLNAQESSPFTRLRWNAALGLMPPIPAAGINAHSTALAWQIEKLVPEEEPHHKKKSTKKKTHHKKHKKSE